MKHNDLIMIMNTASMAKGCLVMYQWCTLLLESQKGEITVQWSQFLKKEKKLTPCAQCRYGKE